MPTEEPPSPLGHRISLLTQRFNVISNSIARRLPVIIPVLAGIFLATAFGTDVYATWHARVSPQDPGDAERVAFTISNYLKLDSLQPAEQEGQIASIALAGENVGGQAPDETVVQPRQYVVENGDTLSTIADKYNLHSGSLVLANKDLDDTEVIHPGQVLTIPDADASEEELDNEYAARQKRQDQVAAKAKSTTAKKASSVTLASASSGIKLGRPIVYNYKSQPYHAGHPGVDLTAAEGTPVYAAHDGCIILAAKGWNGGYGNTILFNAGGGYTLRYAHLSAFVKGLSSGDCFDRGDVIGYSGDTGRSTGPHLHFEVRYNGVAQNPSKYGI